MPSPARRLEKRPSLDNLVERVDAQRPGEITGDTIPTGFGSLDKLLGGGFRRRDLILLGGDIGSGKSALALGIALRVAQQSVGVAYLSGEMNEERLMELALAREVALLVVAQLPGFQTGREARRPTLDDYGVMGARKQHADVILSIFREEMYNPGGGVDGATELLVAKNRNGPTGFVDLYFYRRWMRFEDMLDPDR